MSPENRILSPGSALVDGRFTGLAGCSVSDKCPRAAECLRADPRLTAVRAMPLQCRTGAACLVFIPAGNQK